MAPNNIVDLIKSGERSRLIPVVADMSKEERAVSPLLAVFATVPSFANSMLEEVGAPTNQRARVKCFSQVVFKDGPTDKASRPDGLVIVDSGRKLWSALIEAKVGNGELKAEQIECYLDLAKHLGVDAVITVSNQFAAVPTHHPVDVNKQKLRSAGLYHFSWMSLLTKATLLADSKLVDDPEQAFLLRELIRYLSHPSSGVCEMDRMGPGWKDLCTKVQTGTPINRLDETASLVLSDWHQLSRFLALDLSAAVGKQVHVWLPRAHVKDQAARRMADLTTLSSEHVLRSELEIPNAASRITVEADLLRRSVRFSIHLDTPQDRSRPTAAVSWITRQLPGLAESTDTLIRAHWPGRAAETVATMSEATRDPKTVAPDGKKELPSSLEVQRVVDVAGRFKGPATFVEDVRRELPRFYKEVVQNVTSWVAKPPRLKEEAASAQSSEIRELVEEIETLKEAAEEQSPAETSADAAKGGAG